MEQFLFYFIHWGLPILVLIGIFLKRVNTKSGAVSTFLFNILLLWFLFLWGQWPIAAFYYMKYFLLVIVVISLIRFIKSYASAAKFLPKSPGGVIKNGVLLILGLLFGFLVIQSYKGRVYPSEGISLEFPLREGHFYISSGGSNPVLNNHFGKGAAAQQYALDINKLDQFGKIARGLGPSANEAHYIFGSPIYAPCEGTIIELKDGVKDNDGSSMSVSREDGQGNFLVLDCRGVVITMVHLKEGSLNVRSGQAVRVGQILAKVGNSGFSQEPHLHLQAARWDKDSVMRGIPMRFEDFQPYRNSSIRN